MERTCSETVTLSGLQPLLGTKLLHCGGQLFIQLCANALTLVDNKGKETDELFREVLQVPFLSEEIAAVAAGVTPHPGLPHPPAHGNHRSAGLIPGRLRSCSHVNHVFTAGSGPHSTAKRSWTRGCYVKLGSDEQTAWVPVIESAVTPPAVTASDELL
ncbi:hypothetical protein D9C73_006273 [Collichthys lucidus]|uniref:Uncharacterized protein n=1 Tax=Collichthys lucidus TaxID=240159 RepID=A0A4U5UCT2_COLLU|nr:hypothetical protein D9C73_006273 [Collichthys lucidus]